MTEVMEKEATIHQAPTMYLSQTRGFMEMIDSRQWFPERAIQAQY